MRKILQLIAILLIPAIPALAENPSYATALSLYPCVIHTPQQLALIREQLDTDPVRNAWLRLQQEADQALSHTPTPPENFDVPGYYEDKPGHQAAKKCLREDGGAAYTLALAYQLHPDKSQKQEYSAKAIQILNAWAAKNKKVSNSDGDLTMIYKGILLVLAADLMMDYPAWEGKETFKTWMNNVFLKSADTIKDRPNNWGAWGIFGAICVARINHDDAALQDGIGLIKGYIASAIDEKGELPQENKRHVKGMWYTFFALSPLSSAMLVARNAGTDLFNYTSDNGRSLKMALDKYFQYAVNPDTWPYRHPTDPLEIIQSLISPQANQIELPTKEDWPGNLYEAMSVIYKEQNWDNWVKGTRPHQGSEFWTCPTLMIPGL
ncbi:MAG: alginate lyase family protein [Candidatus Wallbacteria bacterium]|nr:alginate lyase family protein [Candidatus Wallbacteria bacterium]